MSGLFRTTTPEEKGPDRFAARIYSQRGWTAAGAEEEVTRHGRTLEVIDRGSAAARMFKWGITLAQVDDGDPPVQGVTADADGPRPLLIYAS